MSDDLSPMLSQPQHDNAPMISGRGTKIMADMRGAYLAGNLRVLVEWMREDQQLRLRQEIVRGALVHLRGLAPCEDAFPLTPEFIAAGERWLANPTEEAGLELLELDEVHILEGYHGKYDATVQVLSIFGWCVAGHEADENSTHACMIATISAAMQYRGEFTQMVADELRKRNEAHLAQWHLDTAWAILRNTPLPPMPDHITTLEDAP